MATNVQWNTKTSPAKHDAQINQSRVNALQAKHWILQHEKEFPWSMKVFVVSHPHPVLWMMVETATAKYAEPISLAQESTSFRAKLKGTFKHYKYLFEKNPKENPTQLISASEGDINQNTQISEFKHKVLNHLNNKPHLGCDYANI